MCTLSWKPLENGYILFFNRDESRTRALARVPSLQQLNGVPYLAPTDPVAGGTWLLVNAHGIAIGLLNNYAATAGTAIANATSRGLLPLKGSDCSTVTEVLQRIAQMPLVNYPPFHLVVAAVNEAAILSWDGRACTSAALNACGAMLTTSAFEPERVAKVRAATFSRLVGDISAANPERLRAFHWSAGEDGVTSIRMTRPDVCTHSISEILVCLDKKVARFQYSPQPDVGQSNDINSDKLLPSSTSMLLPLTQGG